MWGQACGAQGERRGGAGAGGGGGGGACPFPPPRPDPHTLPAHPTYWKIFKQIIAGLVIFQIVMGGFLLVQRSAGAAIPLILIPLTLAISRGLSSVFQKPLDVMSVRAAVDMDAADAAGVQFARAPSMAPRAGEAPSSLYQAPCFRFTGDSLDDLRIEAAQAKQYAEGTAKAPPLADDAAIEAVREEVASKERAVRRQATLAKRQPRTAGPSTTV